MTYHVKDLEAGPLLDQAVLRALGAVHVQECPEGVPDNVRERWPVEGAMVLTDEAGNMMFYGMRKRWPVEGAMVLTDEAGNMTFYGMRNIPGFSTEHGVGGPILERERIGVWPHRIGVWRAIGPCNVGATEPFRFDYTMCSAEAGSPLVAGCRALVLANLGEVVELISGDMVGTPSAVQGPPR